MGVPQIDITGKKYGFLTAVKWVKTEKHITRSGGEVYYNYWEFICDCGKKKILRKGRVTSGKNFIQSCGCAVNKHKWKGYKEISGTYWGTIKKSARIRHIDFSITIQYAWEVYEKQYGKCNLSGMDIFFKPGKSNQGWENNATASLDRIDSSKGYIEGNVQWVHKDLNIMKWDCSNKEFIDWCEMVVRFNCKKRST